ncbi:efflux RND transporter periplasmic adaptor subunit [Larkinella humicola]|nr:efflux RND transporter periplasmic adaptor subunit [Larkinella humicola]
MTGLLLVGCQSKNGQKSLEGDSRNLNEGAHQGHAHQSVKEEYTCPMHPQIVQDKPGSCPICGMDLVKKASAGDSVVIDTDLKSLLKPTNSIVVATISTVHPERRSETVELKANGIVTYDTRRLFTIPTRFGGRVEKLFVRYNYQPIRKGQKLLEIYSPDIVTAQRELLFLVSADAENLPLISSAKQKLRLLGVTDSQIADLIRTGKPSYSLAVFSPYDGYVVEESAPVPAASTPPGEAAGGMSAGGMSSGSDEITFTQPAPASAGMGNDRVAPLLLRQGQYVQTGQTLFRVVDPSRLWAEFRLYARDATGVKPGDPLTMSFDQAGQPSQSARVSFIVPFFENGGTGASSSFVTIRAYLPGGKNKRVGQLARAIIRQPAREGLWLPATAVLDLGNDRVVFIRQNGSFKPVRVQTGGVSGHRIAIRGGLREDQEVARNAQFLIDSESFINVSNSTE